MKYGKYLKMSSQDNLRPEKPIYMYLSYPPTENVPLQSSNLELIPCDIFVQTVHIRDALKSYKTKMYNIYFYC